MLAVIGALIMLVGFCVMWAGGDSVVVGLAIMAVGLLGVMAGGK